MKEYKRKKGVSLADLPAFAEASAEELRVLCLIAESDRPLSAEELASLLGISQGEAKDALSFWRGGGAITATQRRAEGATEEEKPKAVPAPVQTAPREDTPSRSEKLKAAVAATDARPVTRGDTLPDYTAEEAARIVEEQDLASFLSECQSVYGKEFSPRDTGVVLGLCRELGLSPDYVLLLIAYCQGMDEAARGNKPMRYIEKVAFSLFDAGIRTTEALTAYIDDKTRFSAEEKELRRLLGLGDRPLTAKEEILFTRWFKEYAFPLSVIKLAYDACVDRKNKYDASYMEGILSAWNKAGCKNAADVENHQKAEREKAPAPTRSGGKKGLSAAAIKEKDDMRTIDVENFFSRALTRSYTEDEK